MWTLLAGYLMYCSVFKKLVMTFEWCLFHWFVMWTSKGQGSGIVRWQSDGSFRGTQQMKGYENYKLMNKDNHKIEGTYLIIPRILKIILLKSLSQWLLLGALKFLPRIAHAPIKISPHCWWFINKPHVSKHPCNKHPWPGINYNIVIWLV